MEQRERIKLTPYTTFDLEREEIKRLYTYLSLFQYRYLRVPDYRERVLIEHLERDFRKYYLEMLRQSERDPNNLILSRIKVLFEIHCKELKGIVEEYREPIDV